MFWPKVCLEQVSVVVENKPKHKVSYLSDGKEMRKKDKGQDY